MRILIVGLGSIGHRHLNNINNIFPDSEIIIMRHQKPSIDDSNNRIPNIVYKLSEAIELNPDIAFLTNPSPFHVPIAIELANNGIHLLIEKPLSHDLKNVYHLLEICNKSKVKVMIGYNLRFRNGLSVLKKTLESGMIGRAISFRAEVGQYLPDWRSTADYREVVSAQKELGGGVLLELSHEIDYARWLLGNFVAISAITGRCSDLEIDVEDIAEIIFETEKGVIGNIHLDMVNRSKTRTCQIVGTNGTIIWNLLDDSVKIFTQTHPFWSDLISQQPFDVNKPYIDEVLHFFHCVRNDITPSVPIEDGIAVLQIIDAIKRSSDEMRCVYL